MVTVVLKGNTMSDNSSSSESTALDTNSATAEFAKILSATPETEAKKPEKEVEVSEDEAHAEAEKLVSEEPEANAEEEGSNKITIKVDGKDVELTPEEIADAYKNGLRQSDYTKKTMEAAALRKTADAELNQARQERNAYAEKLQEQTLILQNALESQSQVDWQYLLDNDPVEYLKQQHLYQTRQTALQRAHQEAQVIRQQQEQEQTQNVHRFIAEQQEELLAKLPAWKDETKAKAEKTAIRDYLKTSGFNDSEIEKVADHRSVILARKAMLYDQVMEKAKIAAKKVSTAPQRVERPGTGIKANLDQRSTAFQKLSKSGSIDDAAAVFAGLI